MFILLLKVPLLQYVHIIISLYNNIVILLCIIIKTGPIVTCIIESIAKNTMTHVNVSRVRHGTNNETGRSAIHFANVGWEQNDIHILHLEFGQCEYRENH